MNSGISIYTQSVTFPAGGHRRDGYLARSSTEGPFPGLVIIHELHGLNDNIRDITTRFAHQGYIGLAVDLFAGRSRRLCMFRVMLGLATRPLNNASLWELRAALSYLAAQPGVAPQRLGAVGFCMGGGFAIAWACTDDRLRVIAPFYAGNPRPLEAVQRLCPVVGSYPAHDFTTNAGRRLDTALDRYQIARDIKIYPDAKHSFFNDQGPNYDPAASADAWQRVLAFFSDPL